MIRAYLGEKVVSENEYLSAMMRMCEYPRELVEVVKWQFLSLPLIVVVVQGRGSCLLRRWRAPTRHGQLRVGQDLSSN